jgi:hypothetical protein
VDLTKLKTSDKIIAASGLLLFISSFLPWFKVETFIDLSANGWDVGFFWGGIPALLGLASAAAVLANKLGDVKLPELPIGWGQAFLVAGAVSAVIVVLKLLVGIDFWDRSWGLFVAVIAAGGLAYGGFQAFNEEKSGAGL